ncbi:MAG: hypothetical protein U0172_13155 [Nitrospiraceae bacterium]
MLHTIPTATRHPTTKPHSAVRLIRAAGLALSALLLHGCSSTGPTPFGQNAVATGGLTKGNFRIVQSNVRGDSYGFRLLGFIPIVPARIVDAKTDLYEKLAKSGDRLEGRSIALANATEDHNTYYFIIGSVPRITLTADIIEFLDEQSPAGRTERATERPKPADPATNALVPSSVLKPSTLNSASPAPTAPVARPTPLPPAPPSATAPSAQTPFSSGLPPVGQDAPIAEFDLPTSRPPAR